MGPAVPLEDFCDALAACRTVNQVFALFHGAIRAHGYSCVDYCSGVQTRWPIATGLEWRLDLMMASSADSHDRAGTHEIEFLRHDRALPFAARHSPPWLCWDLWSRPFDHPIQRQMQDRLQGMITGGLVIPLHAPGLRLAAAFLGSELPRDELERLDRETRPAVFQLTSSFDARMSELLGRRSEDEAGLTRRERECLLWAARGKTAWETSKILAISESSVKKHLFSGARKLDARTGTQAVAAALSRGIIQL